MAEYEEDTIEETAPEAAIAAAPRPGVLEYDVPPPQFVEGTVVPANKEVEDYTDAEYIQWCFENKMPYWAIKKEVYLRFPPVLRSITPASVVLGSPSFDVHIHGRGFLAESVIVFAGQDEPTTLNADGTLSTGVNMAYWHGPDTVKVSVRNGTHVSEPLDFTFTAAATAPEADETVDAYDGDEPAKKAKKKK